MNAAATVVVVVAATALALVIRRQGWAALELADDANPAVHPDPGGWRLAALAGVVMVPVAALAWINSSTGFVWDDIKNLRQAQLEGLSLRYLMEPTSGHWAPGHRLADWLLQHVFPFNLVASQVITLAGFVVVLLLFHRLMAELIRPGLGPLLLTLLYGASVVNVGVTQWWSSGMDRVPATIGSFLSIVAYLRFHRTRSWWWLAVSIVALGASFCFYVKPVLVPLYLVLIRVLLLEPERPLRETVVGALREWPVWLTYAAITAAFSVVYVQTYPTELNQSPTPGMLGEYVSVLWFKVVTPNLFGFYLPIDTTSALAAAGVVVAQILFLALVVVSIVRWRPAWRAWAFFGAAFVGNALLIGQTRLGPFPVKNIAYTLYYNLEITWLFFLCAGCAYFGRTRRAGTRPETGQTQGVPDRRRGAATVAVAAGVATYLALSWHGGVTASKPRYWIGAQSRSYLDTVAAGLEEIRAGDGGVALVDGVVPENVVPYFLVAYNSDSEVLPLVNDNVGFDVRGRDLYDVGPDGRVRAVAFVPLVGGDAVAMLRSAELGVAGATPELSAGGHGICIAPVQDNAIIVLPLPQPLVSGDGLYLDLSFTSDADARMALPVEPIPGTSTGTRPAFRVVNLHPSEQETIYELDYKTARQVAIVVTPGARFCLSHLAVGRVVPRP